MAEGPMVVPCQFADGCSQPARFMVGTGDGGQERAVCRRHVTAMMRGMSYVDSGKVFHRAYVIEVLGLS